MGEIKQWYERDFTLEQAMRCIDENLKASVRNFVAVGFYLKSIRDQKLYQDDDCQNFEEFVRKHYDRDKGWASRCIKVNDQLSKDGNSPVLADEYKDYKVSQLVELAYLTDEQRILAKPDMTVKEIKAIRQPAAKSQPEPEVVISQLDLGEKVVTSQPEKVVEWVSVPEPESQAVESAPVAAQTEVMTSQVEQVESPQDLEQEPEVIHFTIGNRTIDNAYGATLAAVVGAYLAVGYAKPEKECEVTAFGLSYKVLKRQDVTVFYTDAGHTVFDVENARLEEEYQFRYRIKTKPEVVTSQLKTVADPETVQEPTQPEERLSAYGTSKRVYPEDSLLTTQGCEGGHDCISCHVECGIRQQDCYCVEAPMGNPFLCEMIAKIPELREITGVDCQFVDMDLAYHRVGDNGPVPCCKKCTVHCEYICERAMKALRGQSAATDEKSPEEDYRPPEEEEIDESYNIGDLPQAKESLLRQLAKVLVERCGSRMVLDGVIRIGGSIKERLMYIDRQDNGIALQEGVRAYPSAEIIEFFRGDEDLGVCTYARFETQARKALDEWVKAGKPQAEPAPESEPQKEVIDAEFAEIPVEQAEDIYDSVILTEMIQKAEAELDLMEDCWKEKQPQTYKRKRMALEAYKMYQVAHE